MLVSTRSHASLDLFPCLFRLVPLGETKCFLGRNKVFPCWEHPLKCHRNNSEVPLERPEGAIGTTQKWWSNELYGLQGSVKDNNR